MNYYPPELTDWWMDDWISLVYGMSRTFKARDVTVVHHTGAFNCNCITCIMIQDIILQKL